MCLIWVVMQKPSAWVVVLAPSLSFFNGLWDIGADFQLLEMDCVILFSEYIICK